MAIKMIELTPRTLVHIFKGRTDRVVLYAKGDETVQPIKQGEYELHNRMEDHLAGTNRMAFYPMLDDSTVNWAVVNFNEKGPSKDVVEDSLMLARELKKLGFRGVRRERTMRPEEEYNIWLFFKPNIPAKKVRYLLHNLFKKIGLTKRLPVYPETDEIVMGDLGQHVWVPYFNGIDKWTDKEGNTFVCKGLKSDQTVFIDEKGNTIEQFITEIQRITDKDVDRAIFYLTEELEDKYVKGKGLVVQEAAFRQMLEGCDAFKNIVNTIEEKGQISEEGMVRLGALLKGLGMKKLLKHYLEKVKSISENRLDRLISRYEGPVFPVCADMREIKFCPPKKHCFMSHAPLKDKLGFWVEDKKAEKTVDPTMAQWIYRSLDEASAEPKIIDLDDLEDEEEDDMPSLEMLSPSGSAMPAQLQIKAAKDFINEFNEKFSEQAGVTAAKKATFSGYNSGLDVLNEALDGLQPGNVISLAGPPGVGKSTLAKQVLDSVADKEKVPCLYISYDLSTRQLHHKTVCRLAGISSKSLRLGSIKDDEKAKMDKVNAYFTETLGEMIHVLEADQGVKADAINRAVSETGAKFAVVDYIQAIPLGTKLSTLDTEDRYRAVLSRLKQIARQSDIPILAVSNGPMTSGILYGSDAVLNLYSKPTPATASSDSQPYAAILNVEKNNHGQSLISIQLTYFPPRMIFYGEKKIDYRTIK